jgi:6-phosphogluconolactonase/glucosamine-6-phosphate isomerase/deaminase
LTVRLEVVADPDWAEVVASEWNARLTVNPTLRMCLPTGATPRSVYSLAASRADFSRSTVFLLDEFGLPPGDPGRCDEMLRRDLLALLATPPATVEGLNPQAEDLDQECGRYEMLLAHGGLDLTMLGLGGNGHLGLNEPGSDAHSPTRVVELSESTAIGMDEYGATAETDWGMTVGMSRLLACREIWLLVTGQHKAEVLAGTLNDNVGPDLPASYLREAANVVVWADQSAASLL